MNMKILKDIRLYESNIKNEEGSSSPASLGLIYSIENRRRLNVNLLRIIRKLNEYNLELDGFDHIYINFTTVIENSKLIISDRRPTSWMKYFDYGLEVSRLNGLSDNMKLDFMIERVFDVLRIYFSDDNRNLEIVERVYLEHKQYGIDLEIKHKSKETKKYKITLSFIVGEDARPTSVYVTYLDKQNSESCRAKLIDVNRVTDIPILLGTIRFKDRVIEVSPRKSATSSIVTDNYETPLCIGLDEIIG